LEVLIKETTSTSQSSADSKIRTAVNGFLNKSICGVIYPVVSELIMNIYQHACVGDGINWQVSIRLKEGVIELSVEDEGIGILGSILAKKDIKEASISEALSVAVNYRGSNRNGRGTGLELLRKRHSEGKIIKFSIHSSHGKYESCTKNVKENNFVVNGTRILVTFNV